VTSELELKLAVDDKAALRRRLRGAGAALRHEESFEDNWVWDRRRELREAGCLLRLRSDARGARLTYKGPASFEGEVKVREEIETAVDDADAVAALLLALGYERARRYQKYREEWLLDGVIIAVDRTPMGDFVEFEGVGASDVAVLCGCDPRRALRADYLALYEIYRGSQPEAPTDMVFGEDRRGDG